MKKTSAETSDQERTRVLIDNAPESVLIFDVSKGQFIYFNQNAIDLFKYPPEVLYDKKPEDLSPAIINGADAAFLIRHYIEDALKGGNPAFEWKHIDCDGIHIPCEVRLVRFPPYDKQLIRASVSDLRAQKSLEDALKESESRLKLALKTTGLGYFDWHPNENKAHWDDRLYEIMGLPKGAPVEHIDYFFQCLHPEERQELVDDFKTALTPDATQTSFSRLSRFLIKGELKYFSLNGFLIRDHKGQIERIIGTIQDITERQLAEEKLALAKHRLSVITERFQISTNAAKVGIWDWDIKNNHLIWDETMMKLYGISRDIFEKTAIDWNTKIHPVDWPQAKEDMIAALKGEKDYNAEFRIIWPDQSVHYIKALGTVQRDENGMAIRMIGTNWDITKEKEAERQKIRARQLAIKNKELEQFAYVASHDLQEPLRTIIAFVGILRKQFDSLDANTNGHLELVAQAASRMNKLINGLLDYSLIGRNKELVLIDCNLLVQQILDDLTVQITETNAKIKTRHLPKLHGYETELRVLFQNLISNAIKFKKPEIDPVIEVSVEQREDFWQFSIADNGIGIIPKNQERIFVIFQRLHLRNQYQGTGIGLAHCQKIVDLHGGRIWVESAFNEGSRFYFTIPTNIIPASS